MWIAYIDETGHTGDRLDDPDQQLLILAAVMVEDLQVQPLARSMRSLAAEFGVRELHGYDMFHGKNGWAGVSTEVRISACGRALDFLKAHECKVTHATIDKFELSVQYADPVSPYLLGLQFLCEKVEKRASGELVLAVADEAKEHEVRAIGLVSEMQEWGVGVIPGHQLDHIIDSLHFVDSEANPGVQLADLVAHALGQSQRHDNHPKALPVIQAHMWTISARVTYYRGRCPRTQLLVSCQVVSRLI